MFPVVTITGPRQADKTTLLKHLLADSHAYVSLELPDVQEAATADPRGFLRHCAPPVILDEIQNAPKLLPYMHFWRTATGSEVDLLVRNRDQMIAPELKSSETPAPRMAESIRRFADYLPKLATDRYVIHAGNHALSLGGDVTALPFGSL